MAPFLIDKVMIKFVRVIVRASGGSLSFSLLSCPDVF